MLLDELDSNVVEVSFEDFSTFLSPVLNEQSIAKDCLKDLTRSTEASNNCNRRLR